MRQRRFPAQRLARQFQSTHSQGVRHTWGLKAMGMRLISIHALTRSATYLLMVLQELVTQFQSTHSQGVRRKLLPFCKSRGYISIHALTRSATVFLNLFFNLWRDFNPRTHKECDSYAKRTLKPLKGFQSTHSQGVRRKVSGASIQGHLFQSTHSQGVRLGKGRPLFGRIKDFNPRTHKECDKSSKTTAGNRHKFQSTHSQGVRLLGVTYKIRP